MIKNLVENRGKIIVKLGPSLGKAQESKALQHSLAGIIFCVPGYLYINLCQSCDLKGGRLDPRLFTVYLEWVFGAI